MAPYEGALRVAGTMELSGINTNLYEERVAGIRRSTYQYLTDWEEGDETKTWVGMRPMLPDGLPAIGRSPTVPNFVRRLRPRDARRYARSDDGSPHRRLDDDGHVAVDLRPFAPGRFDRRYLSRPHEIPSGDRATRKDPYRNTDIITNLGASSRLCRPEAASLSSLIMCFFITDVFLNQRLRRARFSRSRQALPHLALRLPTALALSPHRRPLRA